MANERVLARERGIETRQYLLRPGEVEHLKKVQTDRGFIKYLASNFSYKWPKVSWQDVLEVELSEGTSEKLPVRAILKVAVGGRVLSDFLRDHHEEVVIRRSGTTSELMVECNCGETLVLDQRSLTKIPTVRKEDPHTKTRNSSGG